MAWQQNWSQPLNNFAMPGIPSQPQMGTYNPVNPMQFNPTMTPEQHFAMQQNWQQWQTYQQQYAQWQATYGEKYQQEMQQKFGQNTSIMPPIVPQVGSVSSMPATSISHLPPPPPNQPAPLPPPPPDQTINSSSHDSSNQRSFAATTMSARSTHFPNQPATHQHFNNRGMASGIGQNASPFSGSGTRNHFESVTSNATAPTANEFVAKPLNQVTEDVTDKTPEEKAFDEQFKKWEEEFTKWKLQNANHPDTRAYMEYEQKMEECRTKLLERREQMKRRKLELLQQQQQKLQQSQPPLQNAAVLQDQSRVSNEHNPASYSHSSVSSEKHDPKDKVSGGDVVPQLLETTSNSPSQLFNRNSGIGSGIPGLDLVDDRPNDNDQDIINDTVVINDISPKRDDKMSQPAANTQQQRPDLEAISRGITSILGDPNLASLLSNFQSKAGSNPVTKSVIPSLLDMKVPDIDPDNVPRFNWRDDDDDDDDDDDIDHEGQNSHSSFHQNNDSPNNIRSTENTPANSNQINNCDDEQYDDDFDPNQEHERLAGDLNYRNDDDDGPFQMNPMEMNRNDYSRPMMSARDNFARNSVNQFGSSNFMMNENPANSDNFAGRNRSNFQNDNGQANNFNQNRNFVNGNFNSTRSSFNENMRGGSAGNSQQQNSFNFQANRRNPFDRSTFGSNSNFSNDSNNLPQCTPSKFGGNSNNNFGHNFNGQFNNESGGFNDRNDDRNNFGGNNSNDFCRRRNVPDYDGPSFIETSNNSQSNYRNNSRPDDNNFGPNNNSQPFNIVQNRGGPPADSFTSDNAKDEDFFRPTKVIDYSANSKRPSTQDDDCVVPKKVVDYGHQTMGIVSRPQNVSRPRPTNKYTNGDDFFPVKTIDYNHSSNKHMIKEYYYSIVSKWDPATNSAKSQQSQQSQPVPNRSVVADVGVGGGSGNVGGGFNSEPVKQKFQPNRRTRELKEITYEQLSSINTTTKQGKKFKRSLIMKRSTVNDYPIGHKFYPSVKWQLLNEESRKRPCLPTKRGKRKRKDGQILPFNKTIPVSDTLNDYEEILSNDDDSLEDYDGTLDNGKAGARTDCLQVNAAAIKPSAVRPVRQNVVLMEDIIYNPGRQGRPHKIVIIMRGPPGSGKTFLAKLIKDKEAENDGVAVRILSIDDYFKTEIDDIIKCPETGKNLNVKRMVYEYEEEMEDTYMQYLMKSYKKTVVDGLFDFIIVDSIASTLRHYTEFYNFAKAYAFTPYTCEMEMDADICYKRNIHQRTLDEIRCYCDHWSKTPDQYLKLDYDSFVRDAGPFTVVDDN